MAFDGKIYGQRGKRKTMSCYIEYQVKTLKIPTLDGDEIIYSVKRATFLDIRKTLKARQDLQPTQYFDLDGNSFLRYIINDTKGK
jgi:hypothetical protein